MKKGVTQSELLTLYRARKRDRAQSRTKRRQALENMPKPLCDALSIYFKKDPETLKKIDENRAMIAWAQYVGEAAARVSQVLKLRNRTLVVRVRDPLWMQQLSLLKHELLKKYDKDFPQLDIRDIYFTRGMG